MTGKSFKQSLAELKQESGYRELDIMGIVSRLHSEDFRASFLQCKDEEIYVEMLKRAENL